VTAICPLCDNDRTCFHANYIEPCRDEASSDGGCVRGDECRARCRAAWDRDAESLLAMVERGDFG